MSARARSWVLLFAAAWLGPPASSAVKTHEVGAGESVASIAKRYYGTPDVASSVVRFNGKPSPLIHPGEKLKIPYCDVHRVAAGDTWSGLSERYVGRRAAYPAIALLNRLAPDEPLRVGQKIVMPVGVPYRLTRGDTLASVAQRFYADVELARVLQLFNEIDDPRRLSVGQAIEIPLTTLRLHEKPPEPARRAPEPAPRPSPGFEHEIAAARQAFDQGEYERAQEMIDTLREPVLTGAAVEQRSELLRLQAFLAVAFDRPEPACAAYRSLAELSPPDPLDPKLVSPKIRETLAGCLQDP